MSPAGRRPIRLWRRRRFSPNTRWRRASRNGARLWTEPGRNNRRRACFWRCGRERAIGFAASGAQQSDILGERGYAGEFQAIYLLKEAQRLGAGRSLMRVMAQALRERGIEWGSLWVLRHNFTARKFYEKLGGRKIGVEGAWRGVPEVAYGWRDLGLLIDPQPAKPW